MIELTSTMVKEYCRARSEAHLNGLGSVEAQHRALAAVFAVVEREYAVFPRGAQPVRCHIHHDVVARWGRCPHPECSDGDVA